MTDKKINPYVIARMLEHSVSERESFGGVTKEYLAKMVRWGDFTGAFFYAANMGYRNFDTTIMPALACYVDSEIMFCMLPEEDEFIPAIGFSEKALSDALYKRYGKHPIDGTQAEGSVMTLPDLEIDTPIEPDALHPRGYDRSEIPRIDRKKVKVTRLD